MRITIEELYKRIKARDMPGLTLIHTEETFFIEELLGLLRAAYSSEGGWGYEVVDASLVDAASLVSSAGTLSFGGTTKATVIRCAQRLKKAHMEALEKISAKKASERIVILLADKTLKTSDNVLKWAKEVKASLCHISTPKASELSRWLENQASIKGFKLEPTTQAFMLDLAAANLMALSQMLAKIDIYRGEKTEIGLKDVEDLLADSFEKGVYDCVKAVFARDRARASREMHRVLRYGINDGVIEITRTLSREAFSLLKYAELRSRGLSRDAIATQMKLGPRKWLLDSQYPERAAKWSGERLHNLLVRLAEVDMAVRTTGRDPESMLEQIIIGNLAPTSVEEYDEIFA